LRSSITSALNEYLQTPAGIAANTNYANLAAMQNDIELNNNLIVISEAGNMSNNQIGSALLAVIAAKPTFGAFLDAALPTGLAFMKDDNAGTTFGNANLVRLQGMVGNGPSKAQLMLLLADSAPTNIDTVSGRVIAQDVITNALSYVRQEQSSIANQKSNIVETTDALSATTNVTQQAADSYLKADYVLTAQEYSETLRTMVAAITALQAANKIPEAAQRLLDALTR